MVADGGCGGFKHILLFILVQAEQYEEVNILSLAKLQTLQALRQNADVTLDYVFNKNNCVYIVGITFFAMYLKVFQNI